MRPRDWVGLMLIGAGAALGSVGAGVQFGLPFALMVISVVMMVAGFLLANG